MKKIVKIITIIMIIVIVICGIYYALNKNYFKKKKAVEDDEKNYGEEYMEFKSAVYKEKPERIIIKKQGTANEFYIFDKSNKEYEHILKVALDRMYYSFNQDPNNWAFTPYLIEDISNSNENFIIFDYDDYTNNKDYIYDTDFNRDIFFRFSNGTRLYRLVDYLTEREHKYTINKLREKISKEEFVPANQILSGFKYMNHTSFAD